MGIKEDLRVLHFPPNLIQVINSVTLVRGLAPKPEACSGESIRRAEMPYGWLLLTPPVLLPTHCHFFVLGLWFYHPCKCSETPHHSGKHPADQILGLGAP